MRLRCGLFRRDLERRAGAEFVDGGVADQAIVAAENFVVGARPAGRHDAQALTRCLKEHDQLGVGEVPAWV
jgi:hypothetical protein